MAMNILFTADRGYIEHISDCIRSIIRFRTEGGYHIYILHSDWTREDEENLKSRFSRKAEIHFIYVNPEMFSVFPESRRYPQLIYYRIFAAFLLPEYLDRILYLDGDTIVINPLDELYHMEFEDNYYLACTHVREFFTRMNQYRLGTEEEYSYINSGVMLMNLTELRKKQNIKDVLEYAKEREAFLILPDQDIITALYGDKIKLLDTMKYNLSDRMLRFHNANPQKKAIDLEWVRKNAVVIHYYGRKKPWDEHYIGKLDVFYRELMKDDEV